MTQEEEYLTIIEEIGKELVSNLDKRVDNTPKSDHPKIFELSSRIKGILTSCKAMRDYSIPWIQRDIQKQFLRAAESLREYTSQNNYFSELSDDIKRLHITIAEWSKGYYKEKEIKE